MLSSLNHFADRSANKEMDLAIHQLHCILMKMQYSVCYTQQVMALNNGAIIDRPVLSQPQNWKQPKLYKTTLCDYWASKRRCKYGDRCWFAHGGQELRYVGLGGGVDVDPSSTAMLGSTTSTNSLC